ACECGLRDDYRCSAATAARWLLDLPGRQRRARRRRRVVHVTHAAALIHVFDAVDVAAIVRHPLGAQDAPAGFALDAPYRIGKRSHVVLNARPRHFPLAARRLLPDVLRPGSRHRRTGRESGGNGEDQNVTRSRKHGVILSNCDGSFKIRENGSSAGFA
ncbi:MAG: hypothetical protein J0H45_03675, partial [Stenotrophomonas nitritireducens]|nr:hypothetical protein [Stenotrophomonas nitritireducens]